MSKNIEQDMRNAFANASIEQMDKILKNIDPEAFEFNDQVSKKRIEKNMLTRLGLNDCDTTTNTTSSNNTTSNNTSPHNFTHKQKRKHNILKSLLATVAGFAVVCSTLFTFSAEARELAMNFFSFIPGQGIVETDIPYYIFSEPIIIEENDDIAVELKNIVVEPESFTLEYAVNMKKIDYDIVERTVYEEDPIEALHSYYKLQGYENYFDIDDDMEISSSVKIDGRKLKKISTDTFFNEMSMQKYALITENYSLGRFTADEIKDAVLSVGDLQIGFTVVPAEQFDSLEAALKNQMICSRNGITLVCETKRIENKLRAYFYVVGTGEYSSVESLFPYFTSEKAGAYLIVDGKRIDGNLTFDGSTTYEFDMTGYDEDIPCEIKIDVISAIRSDSKESELIECDYVFYANRKSSEIMEE